MRHLLMITIGLRNNREFRSSILKRDPPTCRANSLGLVIFSSTFRISDETLHHWAMQETESCRKPCRSRAEKSPVLNCCVSSSTRHNIDFLPNCLSGNKFFFFFSRAYCRLLTGGTLLFSFFCLPLQAANCRIWKTHELFPSASDQKWYSTLKW